MKFVLSLAAMLGLATFAPALAATTGSPSITLVPFTATHVAVLTRPGCDAPASVAGTPFFEMPTIAAEQGIGGLAQVKIDLTAGGNLSGAALFASSGDRWLDEAALLSARLTRFTAETVNCKHVAGSYLYNVEF